jgi:hypothetical protein
MSRLGKIAFVVSHLSLPAAVYSQQPRPQHKSDLKEWRCANETKELTQDARELEARLRAIDAVINTALKKWPLNVSFEDPQIDLFAPIQMSKSDRLDDALLYNIDGVQWERFQKLNPLGMKLGPFAGLGRDLR